MGNQTTNTFDLGELEQLIGYQWKIVPINGSGTAEACEVWEFTTGLFQDIDLIEVNSKIIIYPNPSLDGSFKIVLKGEFKDFTQLNVIDSYGRIVVSQKEVNINSEAITLQIPEARQGIYYLQLFDGSCKINTGKLLVFR